MSALNIEHLLARLYTDEALLAEFLADRNGFCRKHAGGDADFFRQIDREQLEFFARSLRWKRSAGTPAGPGFSPAIVRVFRATVTSSWAGYWRRRARRTTRLRNSKLP